MTGSLVGFQGSEGGILKSLINLVRMVRQIEIEETRQKWINFDQWAQIVRLHNQRPGQRRICGVLRLQQQQQQL